MGRELVRWVSRLIVFGKLGWLARRARLASLAGHPGWVCRLGWPAGLTGPQLSQKRSSPMDLEDELGISQEQKKLRLQSSMRMLKDEPVPEGYSRFR